MCILGLPFSNQQLRRLVLLPNALVLCGLSGSPMQVIVDRGGNQRRR
jgi:hypothetical protein